MVAPLSCCIRRASSSSGVVQPGSEGTQRVHQLRAAVLGQLQGPVEIGDPGSGR